MAHKISKIAVWAGDIVNRPGMAARVLEALRNAGANLEFVIARRVTANSAKLFVAPLKGRKQFHAAADVGLAEAHGLHTLRIEGPDRPGLGADLTRALADAGVSLRGLSSAAFGKRYVCYAAFATAAELTAAARAVKRALARR